MSDRWLKIAALIVKIITLEGLSLNHGALFSVFHLFRRIHLGKASSSVQFLGLSNLIFLQLVETPFSLFYGHLLAVLPVLHAGHQDLKLLKAHLLTHLDLEVLAGNF